MTTKTTLTLKQLREYARSICMKITKRDDEYRVNFWDGDEATAYYTDDRQDAHDTATAMSKGRWPEIFDIDAQRLAEMQEAAEAKQMQEAAEARRNYRVEFYYARHDGVEETYFALKPTLQFAIQHVLISRPTNCTRFSIKKKSKVVAHGSLRAWAPERENVIAEMRVARSETYDAPAGTFRGNNRNWSLYRGIV